MKYNKIDADIYGEIVEAVAGMGADALWGYLCRRLLGNSVPYEERKHYFLSVMYRLMKEGRVKLASYGKFLEGTIEEQVQRYSDLWPKDESMLDKVDFQFIEDPVDGGIYYWVEGCFVWIYEDGFMEWT